MTRDGSDQATLREPVTARLTSLWVWLSVLTSFWVQFARTVETFHRDDNAGGCGPVLREVAGLLLQGKSPTHTEYVGGGGGAYLSPWLSGLVDPLAIVPALLIRHDVGSMMDVVIALHLACFAGGGWLLGHVLGAPPWAKNVAVLSLGFSGYWVVWGGNWSGVLIPYAYVPWLIAALFALKNVETRRELLAYELVACISLALTFLTGLLFAAMYGGVVGLFLAAAWLPRTGGSWKRFGLRLVPPILTFVLLIVPALMQLFAYYEFLGGRKNTAGSWVTFSVPAAGYFGLLLPGTFANWRTIFYSDGILYTNLLMMCGYVPVWYLLVDLAQRPRAYLRWHMLILLLGMVAMVLVLSPGEFNLHFFFAAIPVVNSFRWPVRALPAFHLLIVAFFLFASRERQAALSLRWRVLLPVVVIGASLLTIARDQRQKPNGTPASWFTSAPRLDDAETWSPATQAVLQRAGFVANACAGPWLFHDKPRLYYYGTMGAEYHVHTVHTYASPPLSAYEPLNPTIKGCFRNWNGVRRLIEEGPQSPLAQPQRWDDYRGPRTFDEVLHKTFVGAVLVDPTVGQAERYFKHSHAWVQVERHRRAVAYVRQELLHVR